MTEAQGRIKTVTISNPAKILLGYMQATGITDAKTLATQFDIPLRTIQRLKLECATCANDAISGADENANRAINGVSDAPIAPNTPDMAFPCANNDTCAQATKELPSEVNTNLEVEKDISNEISKNSTPKGPGRGEALKAFEAYNETALRCAVPQAAKFTPGREKKIIARLREYGPDGWAKALENIEHSAFLTGNNDRGFRADLDFLLQAESFGKVHDGRYGNGRSTKPVAAAESQSERNARLLRQYEQGAPQ